MKLKFLTAATLFLLSGAASCATIADGVQAHFVSRNGALALDVNNARTDGPIRLRRVTLFLPQHAEQSVSDVAYETGTDVEVVPGQSLVVPLVPVAKLESTMQDHGDVPAVGFSQVYVDNLPNHCEACADLKSYGYRSVGFGAQTIVSLTDNAVTATTLFGGFLVFVSR